MHNNRYNSLFSGIITAVVTPFKHNEEIDWKSLSKMLEYQVQSGVNGVVLCGSTAEASSLSNQEYEEILKKGVECINGRIKVIVGLSTNNLKTCTDRAKLAHALKADGILAVTPSYYRATQEGMKEYFTQIAKSADLPMLLYNVPSRTATDLKPETIAELSKLSNVVGLKDATGELSRVSALQYEINKIGTQKEFAIISGEDKNLVDFCILGGCGVISVISNICPQHLVKIYNLCKNSKYAEAKALQEELYRLIDLILDTEPNPIGIKFALSSIKMCENVLRLPLISLKQEEGIKISKTISSLNLTNVL
ncbi:MAG: 4-hydroxy-tetrahydrodipicolinate synthase [Alphaproteobacteria bacterium]|nr:4-hydroxy-tetrahydrodipicolinate synthase [Rickettsiales bacterium]